MPAKERIKLLDKTFNRLNKQVLKMQVGFNGISELKTFLDGIIKHSKLEEDISLESTKRKCLRRLRKIGFVDEDMFNFIKDFDDHYLAITGAFPPFEEKIQANLDSWKGRISNTLKDVSTVLQQYNLWKLRSIISEELFDIKQFHSHLTEIERYWRDFLPPFLKAWQTLYNYYKTHQRTINELIKNHEAELKAQTHFTIDFDQSFEARGIRRGQAVVLFDANVFKKIADDARNANKEYFDFKLTADEVIVPKKVWDETVRKKGGTYSVLASKRLTSYAASRLNVQIPTINVSAEEKETLVDLWKQSAAAIRKKEDDFVKGGDIKLLAYALRNHKQKARIVIISNDRDVSAPIQVAKRQKVPIMVNVNVFSYNQGRLGRAA